MNKLAQPVNPLRCSVRPWLQGTVTGFLSLLLPCLWSPPAEAQLTCSLTQITDTTGGSTTGAVSLSGDGTRIGFRSDRDTTELTPCPGCPGNLDGNIELFFFDTTTNNFTQITNTTDLDTAGPFLNGDGTRIVFASFHDLAGDNPDENPQVFLFDTTAPSFSQITNIPDSTLAGARSISADGTRIAFTSDEDLTGGNGANDTMIFLFDSTTSNFTQIGQTYNNGGTDFGTPAISADGTRIVFPSDQNLTGDNADGNIELFLFEVATNSLSQITHTTGGSNGLPSINADGSRIAFKSDRDTTELAPCPGCPGNVDGNSELFLFDTTGSSFTQITNTTGGAADTRFPSINGDGTRIAFRSDRNLTGGNGDFNEEIFLFDTATGAFTQITNTTGGQNLVPSISADGTRIAFESDRNLTGGNGDFNFEVFLASCHLTVSIDIKPGGFPNSINPRNRGVIPVAILTTPTFDASAADLSTVRFGRTGTEATPVHTALEDVDGDGDLDLILQFRTQATGIQCGDTSALLTGKTFSGTPIEGSDSVSTVGCH